MPKPAASVPSAPVTNPPAPNTAINDSPNVPAPVLHKTNISAILFPIGAITAYERFIGSTKNFLIFPAKLTKLGIAKNPIIALSKGAFLNEPATNSIIDFIDTLNSLNDDCNIDVQSIPAK